MRYMAVLMIACGTVAPSGDDAAVGSGFDAGPRRDCGEDGGKGIVEFDFTAEEPGTACHLAGCTRGIVTGKEHICRLVDLYSDAGCRMRFDGGVTAQIDCTPLCGDAGCPCAAVPIGTQRQSCDWVPPP